MIIIILLSSVTARAEIDVSAGFVRGLPPGQPNTAAFFRLDNPTDKAVDIISVTTPNAEKAEFHAHHHRNGAMRMERVDSISIPAGSHFVLKPGDHHLMLIGLKRSLKEGELVNIELQTAKGERLKVQLPVRSVLNEHKHH